MLSYRTTKFNNLKLPNSIPNIQRPRRLANQLRSHLHFQCTSLRLKGSWNGHIIVRRYQYVPAKLRQEQVAPVGRVVPVEAIAVARPDAWGYEVGMHFIGAEVNGAHFPLVAEDVHGSGIGRIAADANGRGTGGDTEVARSHKQWVNIKVACPCMSTFDDGVADRCARCGIHDDRAACPHGIAPKDTVGDDRLCAGHVPDRPARGTAVVAAESTVHNGWVGACLVGNGRPFTCRVVEENGVGDGRGGH